MEQKIPELTVIIVLIISVSLFSGVTQAEDDTLFAYDSLYLNGNYNYIIDTLKPSGHQESIVKARALVKVGYFDRAIKILDGIDEPSLETAILFFRMGEYSRVAELIESLKPQNELQLDIIKYLELECYQPENPEYIDGFCNDIAIFDALYYLQNSETCYQKHEPAQAGQIDSALALLSHVNYSALNDFDKPRYHFLKCRIYDHSGEYEVALNHFDDLLKANYLFGMADRIVAFAIDSLAPNLDTGQRLRLANSLKRKRYYAEALKVLSDSQPNDSIQLEIAWCYFGDKRYSKAAEIFDMLAQTDNAAIKAEAAYGRAVSDYRRGRRLDGVNKLLEFTKLYPQNNLAPRALFTAGDFYMRSNRAKSIEIFTRLIDSYPKSRYYARALYLVGKMHYKSGRSNDAVATFAGYSGDDDDSDLFDYWRFKLAPTDTSLLAEIINRKQPSFYHYKSREKLGSHQPDTLFLYDEFLRDFLDEAEKYLNWRVKRQVYDDSDIAYADSLFKYGLEYEAGLHLVYVHNESKNYHRDIALMKKAFNLKLEWAFFEILDDFKVSLQKLGYSFSYDTWDRLSYPFLYMDLVRFHAKGRIDPYLALAVIRRESRFDPLAVSSVGALGLMQLMPATAAQMAKLDDVPLTWMFEPGYNIMLGCSYLRWLDVRLKKDEIVIAAYNAGPSAAKRWKYRAGSDIETYIETIGYDQSRNYTRWVIGDHYWYQFLWPQTGQ